MLFFVSYGNIKTTNIEQNVKVVLKNSSAKMSTLDYPKRKHQFLVTIKHPIHVQVHVLNTLTDRICMYMYMYLTLIKYTMYMYMGK